MAPHGVVLAIAPDPFAVLVALVRGDIDQGANARCAAHGLEHVDRAHHIGRKGVHGFGVGEAHQGLGRHVEDDLRAMLLEYPLQMIQIPDISQMRRGQAIAHSRALEEAGFRGRRQGVADHLGAHGLEPEGHPAPLEARVPREENAFAAPKSRIHGHIFQGALPLAHMSSSWTLSRSVSMGCQKPW